MSAHPDSLSHSLISFDYWLSDALDGTGIGQNNIFVHDVQTMQTMRVTNTPDGGTTDSTNLWYGNSITPDSFYINFTSDSYTLLPIVENSWGDDDIFITGNPLLCNGQSQNRLMSTTSILPSFCQAQSVTPTPTTPASCPWGGTVVTPEPGTNDPVKCQYTFNADQRHKAAEYAVSWTDKACPMFCAMQYNVLITPVPPYPPQQSDYRCDGTDCANFVSQAYLFGGWPMTHNWYCAIENDTKICKRGKGAWAGASFHAKGLPYYIRMELLSEFDTKEDSSNPTQAPQDGCFTSYNQVLSPEQLHYCLNKYLNRKSIYPSYDVKLDSSSNGGDKLLVQIMSKQLAKYVGQGDLMGTSHNWSVSDMEHVAIIVGWGPYVTSWQDLANKLQSSPVQSTYSEGLVPYIVDHGFFGIANYSGLSLANIIKGPKPYYALGWQATSISGYNGGTWNFFHVPDNFSFLWDKLYWPDTQIPDPRDPNNPSRFVLIPSSTFISNTMPSICPVISSVP